MPEQDRLIVTYRYFLDYSSVEIAEMRDIVPAALRALEANRATTIQERCSTDDPLTTDPSHSAMAGAISDTDLPLDELVRPRGAWWREGLAVAAAIVGFTLLTVILVIFLRGGDERSEPFAGSGPNAEPFDLSGYEFVGYIGHAAVPNSPADVAVGPDGTIFVADVGLNRVIALDNDGQLVTEWNDGGFSDPIKLPARLDFDSEGNLVVLESGRDRVHILAPDGATITNWPLSPPPESVGSSGNAVALDVGPNDLIYVVAAFLNDIEVYDRDGIEVDRISLSGPTPFDIAVDSQGRIYTTVTDEGESLVRILDRDGNIVDEWPSREISRDGDHLSLAGITIDDSNNVYVVGEGIAESTWQVMKLDPSGEWITGWTGQPGIRESRYTAPNVRSFGLGVNERGDILIPDPVNRRILIGHYTGSLRREIPTPGSQDDAFVQLSGIEVGADGSIYATDPIRRIVRKFNRDGELVDVLSFGGETLQPPVQYPSTDIAVAPDGTIYIISPDWFDILKIDPVDGSSDVWKSFLGESSEWIDPQRVAVDPDGNVYVITGSMICFPKYAPDGTFLDDWPVKPTGGETVNDLAFTDDYAFLLRDGLIINRYDHAGNYLGQFVNLAGLDSVKADVAFTFAADGSNVYVLGWWADRSSGQFTPMVQMLVINADGERVGASTSWPADQLADIAVGPDGTLYVTNPDTRQILVYEPVS